MIDKGRAFGQTGAMRRTLGLFVVAACLAMDIARANAASEIVVAIRYLQAEGESHSHLFLYQEDGTLLRQLTKDEIGPGPGSDFRAGRRNDRVQRARSARTSSSFGASSRRAAR